MRNRMQNTIRISCNDVDLTTLSNLEVYIKQSDLFLQYVPEVVSASEMVVTVPIEGAMRLKNKPVQMQFAFTYPSGTPGASNVRNVWVGELLKEAGYDPV